jgi:hypothetical protein
MIKSLLRLSKPCVRGPYTVILSESGPNLASLRSNISVSLSSRGNYQSPMKLQDPATTTTSEATPNQYIALILMAAGHLKIGRKTLEHLRKKESRGPHIKDSISTAKEAAQ